MTRVHSTEIDDLCQLFAQRSHDLDVLSLDCFDTLLWRRVEKPTEVFCALQQRPTFRRLECNATLRMSMETRARKRKRITDRSNEVNLTEIYRAGFPDIAENDLQAVVQEELNEEKQTCFAYEPVIRLIHAARNAGMKVIIVSDTYFPEARLRELLEHCLPADIMTSINQVFCSCDYGVCKSAGLFQFVLKEMQCAPERMVHIGDHPQADSQAASEAGMGAFQLERWSDVSREILQMNGNAARQIQPELGIKRPVPSPFHSVFAHNPMSEQHPEAILGFNGTGPIIWSFARWLQQEGRRHTAGKPCKFLFLLRDGYLPRLAFDLLNDNPGISSHAVKISRFTSYAASFRSEEDILEYLVRLEGPELEPMCKQFLLPVKLKRSILQQTSRSANPQQTFRQLIRKKSTLKLILQASSAFRKRLKSYLEREIDLHEGDHLVLVDLGYSGTTQNCLQAIMEQEWNTSVFGLYLLANNRPEWRRSRRGMIDPELVDDAAIATLVPYVAALEMVCTNNAGSVIDYSDRGEAICKKAEISEQQFRVVEEVQQHVLRFVRQAQACQSVMDITGDIDSLREAALAALTRLSFYPVHEEIEAMKSFHLDVNLGTDLKIRLFDTDQARDGLQHMGLLYALTEQRMNIPVELRFHGLELSYSLFAQHRFQQTLRLDDFAIKRETVPVMLIKGSESNRIEVPAYPTYDGYFSLIIPVGQMEYELGIQFGEQYRWLQLKSIKAVAATELFRRGSANKSQQESEIDLRKLLVYDQIQEQDGELLYCESSTAFAYVPVPEDAPANENMACLVTFRPLTSQSKR